MKLVAQYLQCPVKDILLIYFLARAFSLFATHDMLCTLFSSAVGKKRKAYLIHMTWIERIYRLYIPRITRYWHRLSVYLIANNIISSVLSLLLLLLASIDKIWSLDLALLIRCLTAFGIVFLAFPPFFLSYALLCYPDGHPHYRFGLDANFISAKAIQRKRRLLREKRDGLICTPEAYEKLVTRDKTRK